MNPRERMLAMIVGALVVVVGGWIVQGYVSDQFRRRQQQIDTLESQIATSKRQVQAGKLAMRRMAELEERSLPPNAEVARSLYNDWLLAKIGAAEFIDEDVRAVAGIAEKDLFVQQSFTIKAQGTLPQIVDFLHAFYSVDWLHRVNYLKLKPVPESKRLELDMKVDALSLTRAPESAKLNERPGARLALGPLAAYRQAIIDRNLFGPANQPPRLAISGSREGNPNRPVELTARATDADPLDKVEYELVETTAKDVRFDAATGRLTWTPRATGKHEFKIRAKDDGLPSKSSDISTFVVSVVEPAPPPPAPAPRLAFDHAKYTVLAAVLDIGGTGEIWLHIRPTNETLKLHEGDEFEVGSVKGTVREIGSSYVLFSADEEVRRLDKGETLYQSRPTGQSGEAGDPNASAVPADISAP